METSLLTLHEAIIANQISVAQDLLKNGADLNTADSKGHTPLYYAILAKDIEAVRMLVNHGADVIRWEEFRTMIVVDSLHGRTLVPENLQILEILATHYVNFLSCLDDFCFALLQYTQLYELAEVEMLKKCAKLFTLFWPKIDPTRIEHVDLLLVLRNFNQDNKLSNVDWIKCYSVTLEWLAENQWIESCFCNYRHTWHLLKSLYLRNIDVASRSKIIWIVVSSGVNIRIKDIYLALTLFGFNNEVEELIRGVELNKKFAHSRWDTPLPLFVLATRKDRSNPEEIFRLLLQQIDIDIELNIKGCGSSFSRTLGYFSLPRRLKDELQSRCVNKPLYNNDTITKRIAKIVEFPSLVELSRNKAREFMKQNYSVKQPYEFHEAVHTLNVPGIVKDIIRFKRPIYY